MAPASNDTSITVKPQGILGLVLIVVGVLILIYQGFTFTHREQIAKVGPLEVTGDKHETVIISPIIGVVCVVGGAIVLLTGGRKP